jgi:ribosomal-protein-alanine N-acetyltransferase
MPPHAALLRVASQTDAGLLSDIHAAAFPASEAWSSDVFSLQLALVNVIGLLHAQDGLILARAAGGEAEILTLAVRPAARRRGIAGDLLTATVIRLAALGASVVFLEVSEKNTAALTLYLRQGFTHAGRRPAYYSDRSDALVLRMDLALPQGDKFMS